MDQQRILCTYLNHAPPDALTPSTLEVLPTLLLHTYNPEGLARCLVATINRHLFVTQDALGLSDVNIEDVQNYWSHIALVDCSGDPTKPPQVSDPNIHVLLSTAYNEVIFAWVTDFLLYPTNKRVPHLIRRVRTRVSQAIPVPRYHSEHHVIGVVDPIIDVPGPEPDSSRKRRVELPRRTPPQPAAGNAHALDVNGRQADVAPGLDGCRVINDEDETWPTSLSPVSAVGARTQRNSASLLEEGLSQWDAHSVHLQPDEDLYGEALQMRTGKHREKLKRDIYRRDGASCAASASGPRGDLPDEPLFCTQIIPESADLDRYTRFRAMASVFFSGQYDHLLESHPSSSTSGIPPHASPNGSVVDHSSAPPPTRRPRTSPQGPYPRPENILRSSLNAINLSERWLRWFDEGRFVLREWGGQYYVKCLDPSLFHDPAFARQGANPNDPWEPGHGLKLDIGATPAGVTVLPQQPDGGNTAHRHLDGPAPIPHHQQLPTPVPTPTSPAPVSPFYEHQRFGFGFSPTTSSTRYASGTPFHRGMQIAIRGTRSRNVNHLPRYHHRHVGSPASTSTSSHSRRQTLSERELHSSITPLTPTASQSQSHAHPYPQNTASDISGAMTAHPPLHEESPRHPGPFVAGQASRRAYKHSRNTSNDSSSSKPSSRHSINALLNPTTVPKLPPSVVSSVSATVRAKGNDAKSFPYAPTVPLYAPPLHAPQPPPPVRAVRKELWDVDALDPRLVRLHEQIVTMWWATGLPTELAVQTHWVDSMPLEELNVFVLGEQMFAAVLLHKLKLL